MDDTEARYLIDQYNKLISWEYFPFGMGMSFAALAIAISYLGIAIAPSDSLTLWILYLRLASYISLFIGCVFLPFYSAIFLLRRVFTGRRKLLLLEEHRFKNRSLPDTITLGVAWGKSYNELLQLLAESASLFPKKPNLPSPSIEQSQRKVQLQSQ